MREAAVSSDISDTEHLELAFIGLGEMGGGMALCLRAAGISLVVHNRTAARAAPLAQAGARVAASSAEAVRGARIVMLSLADEEAVEQVLFTELAGRLRRGAIVIDTSTVSPAYSMSAAERLAAVGVRRVEACLIGNPAMARAGQLRIVTAGRPEDADEIHVILDALAQDVRHVGPVGSAAALKLAFNLILGNQIAALAEAIALAECSGLERDLFLTALTASGFSSPTLAFRAGLIRQRRYEPPGFRSALMEKDLRLALGEAAHHGIALPLTRCAANRFAETVLAGDGGKDAAIIAELPAHVG
jgi:3-hydroxyisobutyrate dehydrogenase-like beta-hydroxyacid dehydrogenase